MKKRLRKKLLKKEQRLNLSVVADRQSVATPEQLKFLAVECWRIKNLLPEFVENKKHAVLGSIVDKMTALLESTGVDIEDPVGSDYRDGLTINVAVFEETGSLPSGVRKITETLSPSVYVSGKLVQAARVIVSVGTGGQLDGAFNY
jgi:hypothetical protein